MNRYRFCIAIVIAAFFLIAGCNADKKSKKQLKDMVDQELIAEEELVDDLQKAKQVFYSLPSPIETAMLLKRAEANFNPLLLNSIDNAVKYTSTAQKALNFGVYGADLSYASIFSQTQITIQIMSVSKRIADEMGIYAFIDDKIVERLEKNINNRDSTMAIITEAFMSSSSYLREAGRPETGALIIAGGWIEGLYIATGLTKVSPNNNELIDRIIDQKLSLGTLLSLLEQYKYNPEIKRVLGMLYEIKQVYDQITIVSSKVEPVTNNETKITTLQANTEIFVSQEVFDNLCHTADSIRNLITGI